MTEKKAEPNPDMKYSALERLDIKFSELIGAIEEKQVDGQLSNKDHGDYELVCYCRGFIRKELERERRSRPLSDTVAQVVESLCPSCTKIREQPRPPCEECIWVGPLGDRRLKAQPQDAAGDVLEHFRATVELKHQQMVDLMRRNNLVLDDLKDPIQKLAFTFFTEIGELSHQAEVIRKERNEQIASLRQAQQ